MYTKVGSVIKGIQLQPNFKSASCHTIIKEDMSIPLKKQNLPTEIIWNWKLGISIKIQTENMNIFQFPWYDFKELFNQQLKN